MRHIDPNIERKKIIFFKEDKFLSLINSVISLFNFIMKTDKNLIFFFQYI